MAQARSRALARASIARLVEYRIGWVEEPLAPQDFDGYARLRQTSPVPIATGEALYTVFDFKRPGEGEVDILDRVDHPRGRREMLGQRRNLHEGARHAASVPRTGIREDESGLGIIPEIGRMHFALVSGSRCGIQERSARMILRLPNRPQDGSRSRVDGDGDDA